MLKAVLKPDSQPQYTSTLFIVTEFQEHGKYMGSWQMCTFKNDHEFLKQLHVVLCTAEWNYRRIYSG